MRYEINAWLENGEPCLQVLDANSQVVRLLWKSRSCCSEGQQLRALFRELMLLSVLNDLGKLESRDQQPVVQACK